MSWKLAVLGRRKAVLLLLMSNHIAFPPSHAGMRTTQDTPGLCCLQTCPAPDPCPYRSCVHGPDSGFLRHMEPLQMPELWHCLRRGTCCLPELIQAVLHCAQAGLIFIRGTMGSRNRCSSLLPFAPEESTSHTQKSVVLYQADIGMARNCLS